MSLLAVKLLLLLLLNSSLCIWARPKPQIRQEVGGFQEDSTELPTDDEQMLLLKRLTNQRENTNKRSLFYEPAQPMDPWQQYGDFYNAPSAMAGMNIFARPEYEGYGQWQMMPVGYGMLQPQIIF